MNYKMVLLSTVAYAASTFTLAVLWHVVLFEKLYQHFGYFDGEPGFALGALSIIIQGTMLSVLYPHVRLGKHKTSVIHGLKYSLLIGLFFWTSHVLAFIAKQNINDAGLFAMMESAYLFVQFSIFGVIIGLIYKNAETQQPVVSG